jgi:NOL1/NOP2/sun family putative RNA methylase
MNQFLKRYKQLGEDINPNIKIKPSIRINTLKIGENELIKRLKKEKITLEKIPFLKHGYYYKAKFSLGSTPEYLQGYYYLQEAASQLATEVLFEDNKFPEKVLDMAAAPGSKTTHIAQLMNNKGIIIALDKNPQRLISLQNNLERTGVTNTIIVKKDARFASDLGMTFDKILLDAPCSGNYTLEPQFFDEKSIDGLKPLIKEQRELLKEAIKCLKKDGLLLYSTCSLEPEENELQIDWLISKYKDIKIEKINKEIGSQGLIKVFNKKLRGEIKLCKRLWPHKTGTQGFFIAKIRK